MLGASRLSKFISAALLTVSVIMSQYAYADAIGAEFDFFRSSAPWIVLLIAIAIEYLMVNKIFNKPSHALAMSLLVLIASVAFSLGILMLINIALIMSGVDWLWLINIVLGGVIFISSKYFLYSMGFRLPTDNSHLVWITISSLITVLLWSGIALLY